MFPSAHLGADAQGGQSQDQAPHAAKTGRSVVFVMQGLKLLTCTHIWNVGLNLYASNAHHGADVLNGKFQEQAPHAAGPGGSVHAI